ncbi:MAG: VOC family protein [Chloroflexi bacterium]|nr:VOC family protein [Chloroflexota bacterium]MCY3979664.1 VOC family protein [Chloroflexota bacterium]
MYKVTKYPQGTFSWADNTSTNADAAKAFYMDLFGWGALDLPIGEDMFYTMFQNEGEHAAGFAAMMPDMQAQGIPSHWTNYVSVDDVDAMAEVVTANGGTIVFGPMDIFESGRMLQFIDPTGAQLGLWQPKDHIGAGIVNTVGAMCWNELLTKDAEAAKAFYGALFDWTFFADENGYIMILNRGRNNGAMMQMDESFGEMPSMWQPYFTVADIDESVSRAGELGATIIIPKTEAPGAGRFAYMSDPAGAHFYIIQLNQAEPWEE